MHESILCTVNQDNFRTKAYGRSPGGDTPGDTNGTRTIFISVMASWMEQLDKNNILRMFCCKANYDSRSAKRKDYFLSAVVSSHKAFNLSLWMVELEITVKVGVSRCASTL